MAVFSEYSKEELPELREWIGHWHRVYPLLEKIGPEKLSGMTDDNLVCSFEALSEFVAEMHNRLPPIANGLAQQQRRFMKMLPKSDSVNNAQTSR